MIASWLTRDGLAGKRVLLLLRDGLEFIDALMGCLYAGVVPIPAIVPRSNRSVSALLAIAADSELTGVLTGRNERAYLEPALTESLPHLSWLCLEDAQGKADEWSGCHIEADDLALLQYTSGSTGMPKGVMVTHANLMHNQAAIQHSMRLSQASLFVGWLPLYHDMDLIGNIMQPLYLGIPCVLMPAVAFLQKPLRWVKTISKYGATVSGAPNIAYDLCVDKTSPDQRAQLDLSSWEVAFNGSEAVRAETIEHFAAAFAPAGFRHTSFYPCYGMAESTLFVTGVPQGTEPMTALMDSAAAAKVKARCDTEYMNAANTATKLVGCGWPAPGTKVVIVDSHSRVALLDGAVGEIWVMGGSVAAGYYKNPAQTLNTFKAHLANTGEGPFLRTGDLGFVRDRQLFITGRMKDLIIVRGRNHYPQDLEATAQRSNPMLAKNGGAAVGLEDRRQTVIAIVHELNPRGLAPSRPRMRNRRYPRGNSCRAQASGQPSGADKTPKPASDDER